MKKWTNAPAPIIDNKGNRLAVIPERSLVVSHGYSERFGEIFREAVTYVSGSKVYDGFIYTGYLENYFESLPVDCVKIASATPNLSDAEQYAVIHGVTQTNLCGELCAAFLLKLSLEDVLVEWERDAQPIYRRVFDWFKSKKARGTGVGELQSIFQAFEKSAVSIADVLRDEVTLVPRYTTTALSKLEGRAIVGVKINKYSGRLQSSGVLHWVVVTKVTPERTGYGWVYIYNPFSNRVEVYSWAEFIASAGAPMGVVYHG